MTQEEIRFRPTRAQPVDRLSVQRPALPPSRLRTAPSSVRRFPIRCETSETSVLAFLRTLQ